MKEASSQAKYDYIGSVYCSEPKEHMMHTKISHLHCGFTLSTVEVKRLDN